MRNVELLEKTMQYIKDNPEKHDQGNWCGTAQCFAGWAATLTGWRMVGDMSIKVRRDGMVDWVDDVARRALGLTEKEADILFSGENSRETLELMVKDLVNGDEIRPGGDSSGE